MAISLSDLKKAGVPTGSPTVKLNLTAGAITQPLESIGGLQSEYSQEQVKGPEASDFPFTVEELQFSNAEITSHQYDKEILTYDQLLQLRIDYLCVYSDGVLREHRESNGILQQIPLLITNV